MPQIFRGADVQPGFEEFYRSYALQPSDAWEQALHNVFTRLPLGELGDAAGSFVGIRRLIDVVLNSGGATCATPKRIAHNVWVFCVIGQRPEAGGMARTIRRWVFAFRLLPRGFVESEWKQCEFPKLGKTDASKLFYSIKRGLAFFEVSAPHSAELRPGLPHREVAFWDEEQDTGLQLGSGMPELLWAGWHEASLAAPRLGRHGQRNMPSGSLSPLSVLARQFKVCARKASLPVAAARHPPQPSCRPMGSGAYPGVLPTRGAGSEGGPSWWVSGQKDIMPALPAGACASGFRILEGRPATLTSVLHPAAAGVRLWEPSTSRTSLPSKLSRSGSSPLTDSAEDQWLLADPLLQGLYNSLSLEESAAEERGSHSTFGPMQSLHHADGWRQDMGVASKTQQHNQGVPLAGFAAAPSHALPGCDPLGDAPRCSSLCAQDQSSGGGGNGDGGGSGSGSSGFLHVASGSSSNYLSAQLQPGSSPSSEEFDPFSFLNDLEEHNDGMQTTPN